MTETEMRSNLLRLVFGGSEELFEEFRSAVEAILPPDAAAVVRGSSVTGRRHEDQSPFDSKGPGTSDVDLTLVGSTVLDWFTEEGFYIPGVHSKPLSEEHPDVAPGLVPLRRKLISIVARPVNIQATRDFAMFLKEVLFGQPYLTIVGKIESA
ncbi:MAG TPA: hypothetical protein VFP58_00445 [Candidatus Eisenbacteria bacterium]|nr:hypothetical protein [Candidatus Eisenbacteria bacterium]